MGIHGTRGYFVFSFSFEVSKGLDMRIIDVITVYLYGSIDNDIYI